MDSDTKFGIVVGLGIVVACAALFFQKEPAVKVAEPTPTAAVPVSLPPANVVLVSNPPAEVVVPGERPQPAPVRAVKRVK